MNGQKFFINALNKIPNNIERQVSLSMAVSDRIAEILKLKGMTQKEFAKEMKRSEAEVSRWLSGTHNFTLSTIANISSCLGAELLQVPTKLS